MAGNLKFPIGSGLAKVLMRVGGDMAAEVTATLLLAHDTTRAYFFNVDSLPVSARQYDAASGALVSETRGPDIDGNFFKMTYGYDSQGRITTESGWVKQ